MQNKFISKTLKKHYVGIDDTDNKNTRGTGFRARQLADLLNQRLGDVVETVSRHQLFFDPRVPYTSHNSSACLVVNSEKFDKIKSICRKFLFEIAAVGSDVGLCIAEEKNISEQAIKLGQKAKIDIVTQEEVFRIAKESNIYLEGLTGTHDGIIGALSAVGLRFDGNDGRCMWVKGKDLREISGIMTKNRLFELTTIHDIVNENGISIPVNEKIQLNDWIRPILQNNKTILIAEEVHNEQFKWKLKSKDFIKNISN